MPESELSPSPKPLLATVSTMPHTNRKMKPSGGKARADTPKKFTHSKREYITSEDGWTHVADKGWKAVRAKYESYTDNLCPSINMSFEEMVQEHERYKKQWESSDACAALKSLFSVTDIDDKRIVENTVCLGLGSLQALSLEGRRASHTQLAALITITDTLSV